VGEAGEAFRPTLAALASEELVFVDESGLTTKMTRLDGRAPQGQRGREAIPQGGWKGRTILGALGGTGLPAAMTVAAAPAADILGTFVEQVLAPTLRAGPVVVMDQWSAHKQERGRVSIEARGCRLLEFPPSSPDLNPSEPLWSKGKSHGRTRKARTWDTLAQGVGAALETSTAQDARGCFAHCSYTL
jgi:transposase